MSRKSSFSVNVDLGYLRPLDYGKGCALTYDDYVDQNSKLCVPKGQRFFVGGEYSVRGFEYGTLGPTEKFGGVEQIAGGYKQVFFNSEYIYRLNDPLRLVFFADGGWAYGYNDKSILANCVTRRAPSCAFSCPSSSSRSASSTPSIRLSKPGDKFKTFNFTIGNTY